MSAEKDKIEQLEERINHLEFMVGSLLVGGVAQYLFNSQIAIKALDEPLLIRAQRLLKDIESAYECHGKAMDKLEGLDGHETPITK